MKRRVLGLFMILCLLFTYVLMPECSAFAGTGKGRRSSSLTLNSFFLSAVSGPGITVTSSAISVTPAAIVLSSSNVVVYGGRLDHDEDSYTIVSMSAVTTQAMPASSAAILSATPLEDLFSFRIVSFPGRAGLGSSDLDVVLTSGPAIKIWSSAGAGPAVIEAIPYNPAAFSSQTLTINIERTDSRIFYYSIFNETSQEDAGAGIKRFNLYTYDQYGELHNELPLIASGSAVTAPAITVTSPQGRSVDVEDGFTINASEKSILVSSEAENGNYTVHVVNDPAYVRVSGESLSRPVLQIRSDSSDPGNPTGSAITTPTPGEGSGTTTTPTPGEGSGTTTTPAPGEGSGTTTTPAPGEGSGTTTTPAPGEESGAGTTPAPGEESGAGTTPAPGEESGTGTTPAPGEESGATTTPAPGETTDGDTGITPYPTPSESSSQSGGSQGSSSSGTTSGTSGTSGSSSGGSSGNSSGVSIVPTPGPTPSVRGYVPPVTVPTVIPTTTPTTTPKPTQSQNVKTEASPTPASDNTRVINSDGSVTTTTVTTNPDGTVTTTTTRTFTNGSSTVKSVTTDKDKTIISTAEGTVSYNNKGTKIENMKTDNADGSVLLSLEKTTRKGKTVLESTRKDADGSVRIVLETHDTDGTDVSKTFLEKSSGKVKLTNYSTNTSTAVIPSKISANGKKYSVTMIGNNAMTDNDVVKTVRIGKNITSIGRNAFKNNDRLSSIVLGSSKVKNVGIYAIRDISPDAVVKIKADKTTYKAIRKMIRESGADKTITYKRAKASE